MKHVVLTQADPITANTAHSCKPKNYLSMCFSSAESSSNWVDHENDEKKRHKQHLSF